MAGSKAMVVIGDEFEGYDKSTVHVGKMYESYVDSVLISRDEIKSRTKALAAEINSTFGEKDLTLVCVLKGAFMFFNLLLEELHEIRSKSTSKFIRVEFIRVKSYHNTSSTNSVQISGLNLETDLVGNNVVIVEDIVDTARTMTALLKMVKGTEQCKVASLLVKRIANVDYKPDFAGFSIPNKFVIGFGLDYNEYFRDLVHICLINDSGIAKFKQ